MMYHFQTRQASDTLTSSPIIKVDNVMPNVSKHMLSRLFSSAGTVLDIEPLITQQSGVCQYLVTFADPRMAQYALDTLNGTPLFGCNINLVTSGGRHKENFGPHTHGPFIPDLASTSFIASTIQKAQKDLRPHHREQVDFFSQNFRGRSSHHVHRMTVPETGHCNLYILNLSLDMSNENLRAVVQDHGKVRHVCVLATLDNAGRRRAFVDMASHEEAHAVMRELHGRKIHGYELQISFAFVQRSGGPAMNFKPGAMSHAASLIEPSQKRRQHLLSSSLSPRFGSDYGESTGPGDTTQTSPVSIMGLTSCSPVPQTPDTALFSSKLLVYDVSPVACIDSDDVAKYLTEQGLTCIKAVDLEIDRDSGMSLGTATVHFENAEAANYAYEKISSKALILDDTTIRCERGLNPAPLSVPRSDCYPNFSEQEFVAQTKKRSGPPRMHPSPLLHTHVGLATRLLQST